MEKLKPGKSERNELNEKRHDLQNVMHQNFKQFSNELRKKYIKMRKFKEG